jgi:hypothetical protein
MTKTNNLETLATLGTQDTEQTSKQTLENTEDAIKKRQSRYTSVCRRHVSCVPNVPNVSRLSIFMCCVMVLCFVCLRHVSCVPNVPNVSRLFVFVLCLVFPMLPMSQHWVHKTHDEDKQPRDIGNIGYTRHMTKTNNLETLETLGT